MTNYFFFNTTFSNAFSCLFLSPSFMPMLRLFHSKNLIEAGVDEAGRGCLAGPVTASAVILPKKRLKWFKLLNDSKQLTREVREELRPLIERDAIAWKVAFADHEEIDCINILNATYLAMHRAIEQLPHKADCLLIDGNRFKPYGDTPHHCIIKGDGKYLSIAAASVLAKTHRDEYMQQLHVQFPNYGWDHNKAYATSMHRDAIMQHGITPYHRKSFSLFDPQMEMEFDEIEFQS